VKQQSPLIPVSFEKRHVKKTDIRAFVAEALNGLEYRQADRDARRKKDRERKEKKDARAEILQEDLFQKTVDSDTESV
jgi:hypothetical protein